MNVSITIQTQVPAGTYLDYAGGVVPFGFLACDGSTVSRTTYARLFDAIGTIYGSGDGSTTFKLPDFRGRTSIGSGQGSGLTDRTIAATGGEENHALTEAELASHTHAGNPHTHTSQSHNHSLLGETGTLSGTPKSLHEAFTKGIAGWSEGNFYGYVAQGQTPDIDFVADVTVQINNATATNQNTGGGAAHNNMQPFLVATKIIKF